MDNFSKLMADLLAEGKSLEEAVWAIAAKAAKDAIESFTKSEPSAHLDYEKGGRKVREWAEIVEFMGKGA